VKVLFATEYRVAAEVESVTDQLSDLEIEELSWTLVDQVLESLKILKNMFTVQLSRN
jgi:hypothetical protein